MRGEPPLPDEHGTPSDPQERPREPWMHEPYTRDPYWPDPYSGTR